jgi:hypothetical protein
MLIISSGCRSFCFGFGKIKGDKEIVLPIVAKIAELFRYMRLKDYS